MSDTLPHNLEAERALLCVAMLDVAALEEAALPPAAFYHPSHRKAWEAAQRLSERNEPIDPITIAGEVTEMSPSSQAELRSTLTGILAEHHIPASVFHHAAQVRQCWVTRKAALAASDILARIGKGERGTELVSDALAELAAIETEQADTSLSVDVMARQRARELYEQHTGKVSPGFLTGVVALDAKLGGLQPGIVTIVAGRPGMGKSAFAMSVCQANAEAGTGVHVFSLEDTRAAYADRLLSRYTGLVVEDMRTGRAFRERTRWESLKAGLTGMGQGRLRWLVDDRSGVDAAEIVRTVRRSSRANQTRIVVVDYVQLLKRKPGTSMHEHMGEQITALADAAKRDAMAYVVLSQLNRGLEHRDDKRPRLSDLRESGSLEERAKAAIGLYRPAVYDEQANPAAIELHVLKNSQGRTGFIEATWDGPTTTIR